MSHGFVSGNLSFIYYCLFPITCKTVKYKDQSDNNSNFDTSILCMLVAGWSVVLYEMSLDVIV